MTEKKSGPEALPPGASMTEEMRHRLQTAEGKNLYKLRQQIVEPVFGIIKSAMGFRQFMLRGLTKVSTEWMLIRRAAGVAGLPAAEVAPPLCDLLVEWLSVICIGHGSGSDANVKRR